MDKTLHLFKHDLEFKEVPQEGSVLDANVFT